MNRPSRPSHRAFHPFALAGVLLGVPALALVACDDGPASAGTAQAPEAVDPVKVLFVEKEGEALATAGGEILLTAEEFRDRVSQQSPFLRPRYETPEGRQDFVDQLVRFELLAREAAREGIHHDPEVQQALKRAMVNRLLAKRVQQVDENAEVEEARLRAYYEDNISDFVQPERIRVSHIFVAYPSGAEADRARALEKARGVARALREAPADQAGTFGRLARENSEDAASRVVAGDLRYQSREQLTEAWGAKMAEAAFALERVGAVTDVVEGDKGYHVLRLVGRQRAVDRKFEDVRPQLVNRVRRDDRNRQFDAFVDALREREGLVIEEAVLGRLDLSGSGPGQTGPGMPGTVAPRGPGGAAPAIQDAAAGEEN
jgi:peptidyl-prolyl cis-trans isomerase C